MPVEANKQVVRDFFAALSGGDMPAVRALLDPKVAWTIIGDTPVSRTFHGIEEFESGIVNVVFERIKPEAGARVDIIELIGEGDKVVARAQGTIEGRFAPYNNTYCHVFTIRDGKIVEDFEFLDTMLIERALYGRTMAPAAGIEAETH